MKGKFDNRITAGFSREIFDWVWKTLKRKIWGGELIRMRLLVIEGIPKKDRFREGLVLYEFLSMTIPDKVDF